MLAHHGQLSVFHVLNLLLSLRAGVFLRARLDFFDFTRSLYGEFVLDLLAGLARTTLLFVLLGETISCCSC